MAELRILNSPNSRILTACDHCNFVMKTTADSLYYLVECPNCAKDFICSRYKPQQTDAAQGTVSSHRNKPFSREISDIQNTRSNAQKVYEFTVIGLFAVNTFYIGLTNEFRILIGSLILLFFIYIIQFLVNLGLDIQERQLEILSKLDQS